MSAGTPPKKTRAKAKSTAPAAGVVAEVKWYHRDDHLPDFDKWIVVWWGEWRVEYYDGLEVLDPPDQWVQANFAVGCRRKAPGGAWTWELPKKAAENLEYWAYAPGSPPTRQPAPTLKKAKSLRDRMTALSRGDQ